MQEVQQVQEGYAWYLATSGRRCGATLTYPRHNKPALGPLGDSLDDMGG
jgi:hypothetical protein